jgi:long-chain acyl-CoA synthetase
MFRRLLALGAFHGGPTLRLALSGAAPCPWELARDFRARTGVRILRGYGMTELFRPISYLAADVEDRPDAIGRAVPGVELRIVDDAGRPLEADSIGELLIRTPAALDSIFPPEVESVLLGHPDVAEAAVVGVPHAELGEEIAAFVTLRPGARTNADDLTAYCRNRLAAFKYPRRVTLLDALPRSATGKVLKAELTRVIAR